MPKEIRGLGNSQEMIVDLVCDTVRIKVSTAKGKICCATLIVQFGS
jgi:hypothetical protein